MVPVAAPAVVKSIFFYISGELGRRGLTAAAMPAAGRIWVGVTHRVGGPLVNSGYRFSVNPGGRTVLIQRAANKKGYTLADDLFIYAVKRWATQNRYVVKEAVDSVLRLPRM